VIGTSKQDVQKNLDAAMLTFQTIGFDLGMVICDMTVAALLLREGDPVAAKVLFEKCLKSSCGHHIDIVSYCLEQLSDMNHWDAAPDWMPYWPTVFLAHSVKSRQKLVIHKALQFMGDLALAQDDKDTAVSLFTVALEGFTDMDVHHSRAECMLRLGDICKQHNDLSMAMEYWTISRPLFERSSQGKQVEKIDQRLASVKQDILDQHNLADLTVLNAPTGTPDDLSVIVSGNQKWEPK
jgi:hypothetical protein